MYEFIFGFYDVTIISIYYMIFYDIAGNNMMTSYNHDIVRYDDMFCQTACLIINSNIYQLMYSPSKHHSISMFNHRHASKQSRILL
jgi:hypothetical protein